MLEADDNEHRRLGLVEDIFRLNWFINERFSSREARCMCVVRVNLDGYELGDGRRVEGPPLRERLARTARVLEHLYSLDGTDAGYVRTLYLYYLSDRFKALVQQAGCSVRAIEADVEHSVVYRPHEDTHGVPRAVAQVALRAVCVCCV